MDNYDLENWRKIKAALEAANKTDTHYYKRAVSILAGSGDYLEHLARRQILIMQEPTEEQRRRWRALIKIKVLDQLPVRTMQSGETACVFLFLTLNTPSAL